MERWPTRNGISVPLQEIWLPESHLNPDKNENYNLHHREWTAHQMGKFVITELCRDLTVNQNYMLRDVHDWVHQEYNPPLPPTLAQGMDFIERQVYEGGLLRVRKSGHYMEKPLTTGLWNACKKEYDDNGGSDKKIFIMPPIKEQSIDDFDVTSQVLNMFNKDRTRRNERLRKRNA